MTKTTMRLALVFLALVLLSSCGKPGRAESTPPGSRVGQEPAYQIATGTPRAATATPRAALSPTPSSAPSATPRPAPTRTALPTAEPPITFAVIGDHGAHSEGEKQVAALVDGWRPDFILDTGDAYYSAAGGDTTDKYDRSVGAYYCDYLKDVTTMGTDCPHGAADTNRFFPTLGNHDYSDASLDNYLKYFKLPGDGFTNTSGNERYYDFVWGPVHFFALNSNTMEPDGTKPDSKQGQWLQRQLAGSTSPWNIVFFHHPPYSSGASHGDQAWMQWPFKDWGAQAVFSGHEHLYERLQIGGVAYFVNGTGGGARYAFKPTPTPGSQARVAGAWGAQKVTATDKAITFEFYTVDGKLADTYTLRK